MDFMKSIRRALRSVRGYYMEPFPTPLIVHCSYHKCLTMYYNQIMDRLSAEFPFIYNGFNADKERFLEATRNLTSSSVFRVDGHSNISFQDLPSFKGSHFIRDPRDMVVSGYFYHLHCSELWAIEPNEKVRKSVTGHPLFRKHLENSVINYKSKVSFQTYLNSLTQEDGLVAEFILAQNRFDAMEQWDYEDPHFIEFTYEEIIDNEKECFEQIFNHYGFYPKLKKRGLQIVENLSLRNRKKRERSHIRSGKIGQWKEVFTPFFKDVFKKNRGDLLIYLGYEENNNWW